MLKKIKKLQNVKNPKISKFRIKIWRNTDHFLNSVRLPEKSVMMVTLVHTRIIEARALQLGSAKVIHIGKTVYDSAGI